MLIKQLNIKRGLKLLLMALLPALCAFNSKAQTLVTQPLGGTTLAPGNYYSNSSITFTTGFSISGSTGAYTFYIANDCIPLTTMPSVSQNYIMTSVPRTPNYSVGGSNTSCNVMQTVQYVDGLGRPLQTVQVKGSATGNDLVQPMAYDQFGREATKYLPYAISPTIISDGSYRPDALTSGAGQSQFYAAPPTGVNPISSPQAGTAFEPSPLNRVIEQGAPGDTWQLTGTSTPSGTAQGHTDKIIYTTNDGTNYWAKLYTVNIDGSGNRTLASSGNYAAGQLYVAVSQNENWTGATNAKLNTTEEYKDKEGHVVLKRTYNLNPSNNVEVLSTYYVYDDLENLCYVLSPQSNADNTLPTQTILNSLCYQYTYDQRNRMVSKQLPGKGIEEMVYNPLDQVIFERDANEAALGEWGFTKYDAQGRVIMTGVNTSNTSTRVALQNYVTNTLSSGTYPEWETPTPGSGVQGYTNAAFPFGSTGIVPLVVNYYDDYTFQGQPSTFASPAGSSVLTKGLLTATKTAVLNTITNATPDMLWTVHYYDDLGRVTQSYSQHYLSGVLSPYNYDMVTNTYDFTNEIIGSNRQHYNTTNTSAPILSIANSYTYDHMGRKKQTFEQINGGTNVLLSQIDYNEIGQVMIKHLHSTNSGSSFLQDINYTYNERGWLLSNAAPLFSMQLEYNANPGSVSGFTAQYNGNIGSQIWTSSGLPTKNYVYAYDTQNRLISGVSTDNYNESGINYDLNGNIMTLQRTFSSATPIDNLTYSYNSTNQIQSITDAATDNSNYGYRPGTYSGYQYDPNGNMSVLPTPPNGQAVANINIAYNLLNLPQTITGGKTITYTYDAEGNKLRRVSPNTGSTDYINGIQYDQSSGATAPTISFIQTEEGKATSISSGGPDYIYYLGDHLGNTRVTFDTKTGNASLLQQDDYFPFGYEISRGIIPSPKNEYLYNRKELQEELVQFDFGNRFMDPVLARWGAIDPLAEEDRRTTPYSYTFDDPIRHTDPDGMFGEDANESNSETETCCGTGAAAKVLTVGLALAGGTVAVAAPTVVGEVIAVPAAVVEVTGTLLIAGGVGIYGIITNNSNISAPTDNADNPQGTSRSARRDAMRKGGVPTSQPLHQDKNSKSKDQVLLDRDGDHTVQDAKNDESHQGQPHWEAGRTKKDPSKPDGLNRSGNGKSNTNKPQMQKAGKGKSYYKTNQTSTSS